MNKSELIEALATKAELSKAAAGRALLGIDRLADEQAGRADDLGNDVVAERQREGEDRPGDHPRQGEGQHDRAEGLRTGGAKVG